MIRIMLFLMKVLHYWISFKKDDSKKQKKINILKAALDNNFS